MSKPSLAGGYRPPASHLGDIMAETKKPEVKEKEQKTGLTEKEVEAVVKRVMGEAGKTDDIGELLKMQGEAMRAIADRAVPANVKTEIDRLDAEYEDPYNIVEDRVAVLFLSTADLDRIDGWPGYIDEIVPGAFTKQGLPKRARITLMPVYNPSLERNFTLQVMTLDEYAEIAPSGGGISHATMVGAMQLRSGGSR